MTSETDLAAQISRSRQRRYCGLIVEAVGPSCNAWMIQIECSDGGATSSKPLL
jgi:hypothetical protein